MLDLMTGATASFLPPLYDLVWSAVPLVLLAVMVVGLVSLARRSPAMSGVESFVWIAIVIVLPVIGTALWLTIGRRQHPTHSRRQ